MTLEPVELTPEGRNFAKLLIQAINNYRSSPGAFNLTAEGKPFAEELGSLVLDMIRNSVPPGPPYNEEKSKRGLEVAVKQLCLAIAVMRPPR